MGDESRWKFGCTVSSEGKADVTPFLATAALTAALLSSAASAAAPQCAPRAKLLDLLRDRYGETPVAVGLTNTGRLFEVLSSKDGATWTVVITTPKGLTCMVEAGEGWRALDKAVEDPIRGRT